MLLINANLRTATSGAAYSLTCAVGTYLVTGNSATFTLAKQLTANVGAYAVTGKTTSLSLARKLTANAGSYAVAGQITTLTYTAGISSIAYNLTCSVGSYAIAGAQATFSLAKQLKAIAGSYTSSGASLSLVYSRKINAGAGVYNFSGQAANLIYVPVTARYSFSCLSGYYGINPMMAGLVYKPSNITYQPYHFNYAPGPVPNLNSDLLSYVSNELLKVQGAMYEITERHFETSYSPPKRPRDGDIRFADGIKWNPASGIGVYYYNGTLWKLLG